MAESLGCAAFPPKAIGRSSLHRQAQIPNEVINAAEDICRTHQATLFGILRVQREVTIRFIKWIVSAKSTTSLLLAIRSKIGMTLLSQISLASDSSSMLAAYVINESNIQHNPNVQPVVTSPRTFRQSKIMPGSGCFPATKVVKTMSTIAAP